MLSVLFVYGVLAGDEAWLRVFACVLALAVAIDLELFR